MGTLKIKMKMQQIKKAIWIGAILLLAAQYVLSAPAAIDLGSRRELFVDNTIVDKTSGDLRLVLHRPQRREIVFETDKAWEGNASAFQSVMFVDGKYRMYYRGTHYVKNMGVLDTDRLDHHWVLCYAESIDGIHWTRPDLGICEFQKSKNNNIILDPQMVKSVGGDPAHTSVFYDSNPACPPDQRYKISLTSFAKRPVPGMYVMGSADGIHFKLLSDKASVTGGAFDSQNLIFWDIVSKKYRAYYRFFRNGVRDIMTSSSEDILHFPPGKQITRLQGKNYALYTNQMQPYYRAPHIILGFPLRYYDRGEKAWEWPAMSALPNLANRKSRSSKENRYGTAVTDAVLLASRDGETVRLWEESFIASGTATEGKLGLRRQFHFLGDG